MHSMTERMRPLAALLCAILVLGGCANTYITPDTDDSVRGLRFYMPRPYIVVLQPFPVAENSWVLPGTVAPDGVIVSLSQIDKTPLKDLVFTDAGTAAASPFLLFPRAQTPAGPDAVATSNESLTDRLLKQIADAGTDIDLDEAPTGGSARAWIKRGDMTELRDPVNDLFEIRYLPDLSERYVLVGNAGLGTASLDAYLTRGWLAHHYGKEIDRSELGKMVFGNVQAVLDIARAAGKTALIASTGGLGAIPMAAGDIVATSGADTPNPGNRNALLRFTVLEYAVPGVYPILKQEELREFKDAAGTPYHELPISGSFQQPASAALPVGYRTTKVLIVSVLRDGENPTAPRERAPDKKKSPADLIETVRGFLGEALLHHSIDPSHVTLTPQVLDTPDGSVEVVVTVARTDEFTGDEAAWRLFLKTLADKLNKENFPETDRVRLEEGAERE